MGRFVRKRSKGVKTLETIFKRTRASHNILELILAAIITAAAVYMAYR